MTKQRYGRERQVPEKLVQMFPEYTRKELYLMLYPFWTAVTDKFKRKKWDVSATSITVQGLGRFVFKSTAKMKKTARKLKAVEKRKIKKLTRKVSLKKDKLLY